MNNLIKSLLSGAALGALTSAAVADPPRPAFSLTALHQGHAVNKTRMRGTGSCHFGCTTIITVSSHQPANAPKKTHLIQTYYKWNSNGLLCSKPKEKMIVPKKSLYARTGAATETYSGSCVSGPVVYYGDTWTNKTGVAGETDQFISRLIGVFHNGTTKYRGVLELDVNVNIE